MKKILRYAYTLEEELSDEKPKLIIREKEKGKGILDIVDLPYLKLKSRSQGLYEYDLSIAF